MIWLIFLLLSSCSGPKTFNEYVIHFQPIAQQKEALILEGTKEVGLEKKAVLFTSPKHVGIDEARRLLVWAVHTFLETLELESEKLIFGIQFKESDGSLVGEGFIAEVTLRKDKIHYYLFENGSRVKVFVEEFEEAFPKAFGEAPLEGFRPFSVSL